MRDWPVFAHRYQGTTVSHTLRILLQAGTHAELTRLYSLSRWWLVSEMRPRSLVCGDTLECELIYWTNNNAERHALSI